MAGMRRRDFLWSTLSTGAGVVCSILQPQHVRAQSPTPITSEALRPTIPYGVASGDMTHDAAIVWSRSNRPSRMLVDYATTPSFTNARRVLGPAALEINDFTARVDLRELPPGQEIFYRVMFQDLDNPKVLSAPVKGHFRTAPMQRRDVSLVWSGDTAGQGWGINPTWGGMKLFEQIRRQAPDFFIHCGDYIYADNPIQAEVPLEDGSVWKNVTTPAKAKVAETLDEFRGNYLYNLLDENLRRLYEEVPVLVQWDDHETTNNWFPGGTIDERNRRFREYTVKSHDLLAAYARQAFLEYTPMRLNPYDPTQIYRAFHYGPTLDIFMLDERSYRGPNSANRQVEPGAGRETDFLGAAQMQWLKRELLQSKATWKVISSDMPLGLEVPDVEGYEAWANGDGPPLGRELELASLLRFIKNNGVTNVVWITADVHYAAAHRYDPGRAQFTYFEPFWEFVAGPLHAGTFGPNKLDPTFGPHVEFTNLPANMKPNRPPSEGLQSFGRIAIASDTDVMTVSLHGLNGETLYSVELLPGRS